MSQQHNKKNNKKNFSKGFTLLELLVSIAIFAVVLVVIMGTIVTIMDTNRKARTLTEVMNNLNFAIESMTRSLKTGTNLRVSGDDIVIVTDQNGDSVTYSYLDSDGDGTQDSIQKEVNGDASIITSSEVNIEEFYVERFVSDNQPRIFFVVRGKVETNRGISSDFNIQSTVSQRKLELPTP